MWLRSRPRTLGSALPAQLHRLQAFILPSLFRHEQFRLGCLRDLLHGHLPPEDNSINHVSQCAGFKSLPRLLTPSVVFSGRLLQSCLKGQESCYSPTFIDFSLTISVGGQNSTIGRKLLRYWSAKLSRTT